MQLLSTLDFPGNVRQLENLCNWITVMAPGQTVEMPDLPQDILPIPGAHRLLNDVAQPGLPGADNALQPAGSMAYAVAQNWTQLLDQEAARMLSEEKPEVIVQLGKTFESVVIRAALRHTHGRKNDAAIRLGIGRNTITRKIQELGIDGAKDE